MKISQHRSSLQKVFTSTLMVLLFWGCQPQIEQIYPNRIVEIGTEYAQNVADQIQDQVSLTVADGFELDLWASDTLVNDPIAISIDEHGKVFYTLATRQTNSEFDIRGHRDWMEASISFKTVEDRRQFLKATFSETNQEGEQFLKDLNRDGQLDWRDLAVEKEQVWFVEDTDGDGLANRSQLYLEDFHEEITDVANGVEAFDGEVFVAVGPDLWRTSDRDGDGIADLVNSISHGYAVHIGFGAHGMSGAKIGPDGRIWWGIGDIGMNVVDQEGNRWEYPNRGVVVRSELDGSGFEVYAAGVRNTHEFVFDKYGNLISVDNDGDHRGERERLVYLINGSDTGWRINWQFGKYSDPKNNDYKVWMDENMHVPHQEGQAAFFLPPIANYVNGPTGMVYNPGTALGENWREHFFVAEFRGTPVNSPLHAFTLEPKGAGFELAQTQEIVRGVLPTGVDFGPDGALYFSDWIDGWNPKGQGRIWKLDVVDGDTDPLRSEVQSLLEVEFSDLSGEELLGYLSHQDMRVRQKAQFELADRGSKGLEVFKLGLQQEDQLARIHAIWGIGQIARREDLKHAEVLLPLLQDHDPEITTQASKILGDIRYLEAGDQMVPLLNHESLRVQLHATEALGRIGYGVALPAVVDLIEKNNDQDIWLRHAAMIALSRFGDDDALSALSDHPSKSVRLAAVVALRRMKSPAISAYLSDRHEDVVTEAARGINDDLGIEEALPALASILAESPFGNEALIRRAINANQRLGKQNNVDVLIVYSQQQSAPADMRGEALQALSQWASPSAFDRVDGRYLGTQPREDSYVRQQLGSVIASLLNSKNDTVQLEAATAAGKLKLMESEAKLMALASSHNNAAVRRASLQALADLPSPQLNQALRSAFRDNNAEVRSAALAILPESKISEEQAVTLFDQIMKSGTYQEQQVVLSSLGGMTGTHAISVLDQYLGWLESGKAPSEIKLDILEAVKAQNNDQLMARVVAYEESKPSDDPLSPYLETLNGGNSQNGQEIFRNHEAAQCIRCHTIFETGGTMGPGLSGVGSKYTARSLLLALIEPSSSFAEGYHMVTLKLNSGATKTGLVQSETDQSIVVKSGNQEAEQISKSEIVEQTSIPSSMPPMGTILNKKEIRDVLAYLVTLDGEH